ncbi:MAG: hypothetical protein LBQ35_08280 [Spirochaetaceae bacterium]|jgi:nickel transport protein|nr:hypothetical protein [Spirochaetaceae bacterium]
MRRLARAAVLAAALTVFTPAAVFAHGVESQDRSGEAGASVKTVYFGYSTGEPMMFARVKLYAPSRPEADVLQGVTSRGGFFSFLPDEEGPWRLEVEDGMGHKGGITVSALSAGAGGEAERGEAPRSAPLPLRAGLGLSLIVNIFAVWHFAGKRRGEARAH